MYVSMKKFKAYTIHICILPCKKSIVNIKKNKKPQRENSSTKKADF